MIESLLVGILGIVTALYAWYKVGKTKADADAKSEAADVKVAATEKAKDVEVSTIQTANEVQNAVIKTDIGAVADGMHDKYTRD